MNKIILVLVVVLFTSCAANTSFNSFYQDHERDSEFSFGLSSSLIASFLPDEDIQDLKPLLKKAKHIRILVFSEYAEDKTEQFDAFINRSKFERMIKLKSKNDRVSFFTLQKRDNIKEIVLEVSSSSNLVLIGLKTNLSREELEKIIDSDV